MSAPDAAARDAVANRRLIRRAFERAAAGYDTAAVLQGEVAQRMLARLDYMTIMPRAVLDLGTGTGHALPALRGRYPHAVLYALDIALGMLTRARSNAGTTAWQRWRGRGVRAICGDAERLPLRDATLDLVWSNLTLQWTLEPGRAFAEIARVLAPGGLLMFTTFGPDTLRELRRAYAGIDGYAHVNRFVDMHDLGDMLVHSGYADPVMDMEYMTLTYADVRALMHDLRAIGAHTVLGPRRPGMMPRAGIAQVERHYETLRSEGRLPATFEVIYGHAWKPQPPPPRVGPGGRPVIDIRTAR